MTKKDIAVVGDGISGLCMAYYFNLSGCNVTIYSQKSTLNASMCSQGVITSKGMKMAKSPLFAAKIRGQKAMEMIITDLRTAYPGIQGLVSYGVYEPFVGFSEFTERAKRVFKREFVSGFGSRVRFYVDPGEGVEQEMSAMDQHLSKNCAGSFFYPKDYFINTPLFLKLLKELLLKRGVNFIYEKVNMVCPSGKFPEQSQQLQIERRNYDLVFLCNSLGVNQVLKNSGLPSIDFRKKSGLTLEVTGVSMPASGVKFGTKSMNFLYEGFRVGSFDTSVDLDEGDVVPEGLAEECKTELIGHFRRFFGTKKQTPDVVKVWAGTRLDGRKRLPVVGSVDSSHPIWKNLWIVSGFHKSGYVLAPYFSELLSELLPSGVSEIPHSLVADRLLCIGEKWGC